MIKDSGERRQFETGAVRDIQEGKGRCDLMPLDVVATFRGDILRWIEKYQETGNADHLHTVLQKFADTYFEKDMSGMFLEVAKHFEDGAKKYGEHNWQKGIPTHCYIDSAVRHYLKYRRGDVDEPHDRAFVWNILCCIWTCIHKPELNDYLKKAIPKPVKTECKDRAYFGDYDIHYCNIDKKICDDVSKCHRETENAEKN